MTCSRVRYVEPAALHIGGSELAHLRNRFGFHFTERRIIYVRDYWNTRATARARSHTTDRFLHEHLHRRLRREDEKRDAALENGGAADFKPNRPWAHIVYLATTEEAEGSAEHRWWAPNFIEKTTLVVAKVAPVSRCVDGDASIAQSHAEHLATRTATVTLAATGQGPSGPGAKRGRERSEQRQHQTHVQQPPPARRQLELESLGNPTP